MNHHETVAGREPTAPSDEGPFFHGTVADRASNYRPEVVMNHIYFTALRDGAGLAAEIASELANGNRRASTKSSPPARSRTIQT